IDGWLRDAGRWTLNALAGRRDDEETSTARRRLAADAVELYMLSTHLAYDTSLWQGTTRWVRLLRQRMVMLLPILSSIADRMAELRRNGAQLPPAVQALLGDLSAWIAAGPRGQREDGVRLRTAIARIEAETPAGPSSDWNAIMLASLLVRLRELVETVQDCRDLRRQINSGGREGGIIQERRLVARAGGGTALHRDHGMALLSGFSAALAVLLCCVFWIATEWPDGAVATEMAAVACCFFAAQDDPVPAIVSFTIFSTVALVIDTVYLFAILPMIDGFPMLVLVLAPCFLLIGIGMAKARFVSAAMALAANSATLMGLQSAYSADFASFMNSGLALVFGMSAAAVVTALVRSVGAEWSARRLLRAGWADIAAVAATAQRAEIGGAAAAERTVFAGRMLDRLGMLTPRLAMVAPGADVAAADALTDLRIGLNVVDLQRGRPALPPEARRAVDALLDALSRFFDRHASAVAAPPPEQLLRLIDRALARVTATGLPGRRSRSMLLALVGIRRGLFPDAPPYKPASPAPVSPSPVDMREVA
ncbi:MAG TPA: FUSC family protein, partial [Stellaceae bacterium]